MRTRESIRARCSLNGKQLRRRCRQLAVKRLVGIFMRAATMVKVAYAVLAYYPSTASALLVRRTVGLQKKRAAAAITKGFPAELALTEKT